jgi:ascorbate-specific PTS system EIIC-type component UlaA
MEVCHLCVVEFIMIYIILFTDSFAQGKILGALLIFFWYFFNSNVIFKIINRLKNNNNFKFNHIIIKRTSKGN